MVNCTYRQLSPSKTMLWSDLIPLKQQIEISEAVKRQLCNLPVNLFIEWLEPKYMERRWFVEAAKHIDIPYPEYWQEADN